MNLLSILALVMLALVGYAAGVTAVARHKTIAPTVWDLLLVLIIWIAAFALRGTLGHWLSLLVWLLAAGVVGGVVTAVRRPQPPAQVPLRRRYDNPFRRFWETWKQFANDMGNFQSRLLMGFFYFTLLAPFGAGARLTGDALHLKPPQTNSGWQAKEPTPLTIEESRRQG